MNAPATASLAAGATTRWRDVLLQGRRDLHARYRARAQPGKLLADHCRLVDSVLRGIWAQCALPGEFALAAVGGYGRGELYPYSDVDLLFLLPDSRDPQATRRIEPLIGLLWDMGLEVGHSVRSLDECLSEASLDAATATSLSEARFVCGDQSLVVNLATELRKHLVGIAYFQGKLAEQRARHARHHDTAFNLEPNIKESPGGLRDLQMILWLAWGAGLKSSWAGLTEAAVITPLEARRILRLYRLLQDLRIRLHYAAGRREDRLLFDLQTSLARQYGLTDRGHRRASEYLMQRYYRAAKVVGLDNTILTTQLLARLQPPSASAAEPIDGVYERRGNLLGVCDETLFVREPGQIFEAMRVLQRHPGLIGFTPGTLRALWRSQALVGSAFRRDPANQARFLALLRSPRRVTEVMRRMNHYGLLGRYIPAFGRIVGQMQHDLFHAYTVDEHILKVLRNLRRFTVAGFIHEFPHCSQIMADFERADLLYIAALFHDIAKGRGGDHSTLGARDALAFCRRHGLSREDQNMVVWLVVQHLTMSITAQKQDLSDPAVIRRFAELVGDQRHLDALYLLTVADIRGTSPKVWNAWKAKLLEDLYRATWRQLQGSSEAPEETLAQTRREAQRILRQYAVEEARYRELWDFLDDYYFQRHEAQEIAWQTRNLLGRERSAEAIVRARLSPIGEGLQVMIYSPDHKALFARICGFFERMSFTIAEAKVHTTRHGYALDSFQVMQRGSEITHYRDVLNYVEQELQARLIKRTALEAPMSARVSRHLRHFPLGTKVRMSSGSPGMPRALTVIAGDRPGLLYRIAQVFLEHGIVIHGAKINTLGERAEDTFLISGDAVDDPDRNLSLQTDLQARIDAA